VLRERHLSLERLYRFSQVVSHSPELTEVMRRILEQAKEVLQSDFARVTLLPSDTVDGLDLSLSRAGALANEAAVDALVFGWVFETVVDGGEPLLIERGTRDPRARALLAALGVRDAILVPFQGEAGGTGWLCVGDRQSHVRGFVREDVRVLETVANHAAVALRNGRLIEQLRHESLHDALTGLPNRAYLQRQLDTALAQHRIDGHALAVMIIDLDRFKEVNDTLGHQHGDALLQEVARRMSAVAGDRALLARLGGDEFAVILEPCHDPEHAVHFARSLVLALQAPITLDDVEVEIGGSIGIALAPDHASDPVRLLKRADLAMYAAKDTGRGVCLFEPSMDVANPQRLALVGELRQAIALENLEVVFQPKADLSTERVVGTEALCRWFHPQHGWIPPEEFIPLAERSGLIRPLTTFVLRSAIAACADWQAVAPGVGVAVNLSARSVVDDDIVEDVLRYLRRYDVPPALVTLELTEGSIMADPVRTIGVLAALAEAGIRLSIDDFGTGYSSLSYLRRLPVNEVKIDKSFVQGIASGGGGDDSAIVRSIVDLAHNLSLEVVAEGVETADTWQVLAAMGCSQAQGFFVSRPLNLGRYIDWLGQRVTNAVDLPIPNQPGPTRILRAL
jgi:diguanylate cyclase (GGDEF)-like protein